MFMTMHHDAGLQRVHERLHCANICQRLAPVRQARQWRMVDQHDTEQATAMHVGEHCRQSLTLRVAQCAAGEKRRRRQRRVKPDQCHTSAFAHHRIRRCWVG